MTADRVDRKLSAILAADVAGYSRLMGADEEGTLASLTAHRRELFDPTIAKHRGRIVKTTGDGLLAEFASVVDAVRCAAEVQTGMALRNADVAADRRLDFRIGINVGDIVIQDGDIFGDGVNIAARLEGIAEPGGICVSQRVQEDAAGKTGMTFEDMGEQSLKNIARPVRAYRLRSDRVASTGPIASPQAPNPTLPDRPALAVLPFQNMSGDAEQGYFADGIVEDIITALSRFRSFAVVARNSSFVYKGRAVDVRQSAKELGVRYILEGSVRRAGNRLRVTAQLVEGTSGAHLWADRFDGGVEDVFDVQDRITESVVGVIEPQIRRAEIQRSRRKRPESLDAYDLFLRGVAKVYATRPEDSAEAYARIMEAIALEPGYGPFLSAAAHVLEGHFAMGWPPLTGDDRLACLDLVRRALAVADGDPQVLAECGLALMRFEKDEDRARQIVGNAVAANPNNQMVLICAAIVELFAGKLPESIEHSRRAILMGPGDPMAPIPMITIAHANVLLGNYEEAIKYAERALAINPNFEVTHWMLAAANAHAGKLDEARRRLAGSIALSPGITIARIRASQPASGAQSMAPILEGLRLAGLPEG